LGVMIFFVSEACASIYWRAARRVLSSISRRICRILDTACRPKK
jgi:hypothetical protein